MTDWFIRGNDIGDVGDSLFAGLNREFRDIFGAMPEGPRDHEPSPVARSRPCRVSPAIARKDK